MRTLALLTFALFLSFAHATIIDDHIQITLRKIDPLSGEVKWSYAFSRDQRPYRCEAYRGRIVVFLYSKSQWDDGPKSELVFLNSKTGRMTPPFDTRDFAFRSDDPQITRSRGGSQGSILDERGELWLPNGWVSHGAPRLPWYNARSNKIYFSERYTGEPKWSMTLPEGACNLSHWSNILVFYKWTDKDQKRVGTLYGQVAGHDSPTWEFQLPADVPDVESRAFDSDVIGSTNISREFTHVVGKQEIYVVGDRTLFALEPITGKTVWKVLLSNDPVIKKIQFGPMADVLEFGDHLILIAGDVMATFSKASRSVSAVLRKDIHFGPLPIVCDGFVYCFTAQP